MAKKAKAQESTTHEPSTIRWLREKLDAKKTEQSRAVEEWVRHLAERRAAHAEQRFHCRLCGTAYALYASFERTRDDHMEGIALCDECGWQAAFILRDGVFELGEQDGLTVAHLAPERRTLSLEMERLAKLAVHEKLDALHTRIACECGGAPTLRVELIDEDGLAHFEADATCSCGWRAEGRVAAEHDGSQADTLRWVEYTPPQAGRSLETVFVRRGEETFTFGQFFHEDDPDLAVVFPEDSAKADLLRRLDAFREWVASDDFDTALATRQRPAPHCDEVPF